MSYKNKPLNNTKGFITTDKRLLQQASRLAYVAEKKRDGWSDRQIGKALGTSALRIRLIIERMTDEMMFAAYKDFKAEREKLGADIMATIDRWRPVVMQPYKIEEQRVTYEEEDEDGNLVEMTKMVPVRVIDTAAIQAYGVWLKAHERLARLFGADAPLTIAGSVDVNSIHKFVLQHTSAADQIADAVPQEPWQEATPVAGRVITEAMATDEAQPPGPPEPHEEEDTKPLAKRRGRVPKLRVPEPDQSTIMDDRPVEL